MNINLHELQRLYADCAGYAGLSLDEINDLNQKAMHIYPDVKEYYYLDREESINQWYKRLADWFKLRKELGLIDEEGGFLGPKNRVLDLAKFALDAGPLSLHFTAFQPAVELLASDE